MGDNRWLKNSFVYLIILVAALALFLQYFGQPGSQNNEKGIAQVIQDAKAGKIERIESRAGEEEIIVTYQDDSTYRSRIDPNDSVMSLLAEYDVPIAGQTEDEQGLEVIVQPAPAWSGWLGPLTFMLPMLLLIGFFFFFMRHVYDNLAKNTIVSPFRISMLHDLTTVWAYLEY